MANNNAIYNAALAGAATGQSSRWLISQSSATYAPQATLVAGFAAAVDALIAPGTISQAQADLLESICAAFWKDRVLTTTSDITSAAAVIVANYTANATNLLAGGVAGDNKVKVSSGDTTADYLLAKLSAGSGITLTKLNAGANEQVEVAGSAADDHKVAASATDTTPNYLFSKLAAGAAIALTLLNGGANETVSVAVSGLSLTSLSQVSASPSVNQFLQGNGPGVANSWGTLTSAPANPGDNNKVAIPLNGDFTYAFVSDVNVSTTAAIAVSKLAPAAQNGQALITTAGVPAWGTDFGAQTLTTTGEILINNATNTVGFLQIGTNSAGATRASTVGSIRLVTGGSIFFRNSGDTADCAAIQTASSTLTLGQNINVSGVVIACASTGQVNTRIGANTTALSVSSTAVSLSLPLFFFDSAQASPAINQQSTSSAAGQVLSVSAQSSTFASGNGGQLRLSGGDSGTGLMGGVQFRIGVSTASSSILELKQLTSTQRVLGFFAGGLTTTQMPANTGDYVIFIANAATNPTASAVGGGILYATAGALHWRGSGGTDTPIAAA